MVEVYMLIIMSFLRFEPTELMWCTSRGRPAFNSRIAVWLWKLSVRDEQSGPIQGEYNCKSSFLVNPFSVHQVICNPSSYLVIFSVVTDNNGSFL